MPRVLLERDSELTAIGRQLLDVHAGSGRVIIVDGPAGIGKSSLLTASAEAAQAAGMRTLRAAGSPLESDAGWGIARQIFAPVRGEEWVGAAALARRALDADDEKPVLGSDAMHAATHGLTWLAAGLAERVPTVMVVDDVHWSDAPSLRWLVGLGRQIHELPLALLVAVRTGEPAADGELLDELLATAPEPPVRPRPLGPDAVAAVVSARLPAAGPTFAHACHAATGGNPFLLGALLNQLIAERVAPTDEVATTLHAFGPEQVARGVGRQLARLPAGAASLARAFAVLGRGAPLRHARELAGLGPEEAPRLADQLRATGLLDRDDDEWFLVHPLVRSALYAGMAPGERALWHGRAARMLEGERADPETVSLHLLHTEPVRDATTVAMLRAAAARASIRGAPQSAAVFLRRALVEPPSDRSIEADIRSDLGLALAAHVRTEAPALLAEAVELAATPDQRSRIALDGARALGLSGHFPEAIRLCRAGLERPQGVADDRLARLEAELVGNLWLDKSTVDEARARIHAHSPGAESLWGVLYTARAHFAAAPASESRALLDAAIAGRVLETDRDSILGTHAKYLMIYGGQLDAAREHCTALIELARPRGWLIALAHGSFLRAMALTRAGEIFDAAADARLGYELKRPDAPPPALAWSALALADALLELDELDDADRVIAATFVDGAPPTGTFAGTSLLESRARLRLAQHRPAEAHADLAAAAEYWQGFMSDPVLAAWRVSDSEALMALGERATARRLAEEHLDVARRVGLPGAQAAGLRALARTAEPKPSIDLLEQAVDLLTGSPERLEHTRVLVELGVALRRANQREAAREPLRRALAQAERGGMRLLARRARHELEACGARPRRAAVTGIDSLTSAEHRVATLAAQGHSNPEIAQRLYVTRRTVETHLTHVYAKLGVATRTELVVRLMETGSRSV